MQIVGGADDILVIDGSARPNTNGAALDTCQGQGIGNNVNYYFAKTGSFTIAAADTKGGTVGYSITAYFSSSNNCGSQSFTALPETVRAASVVVPPQEPPPPPEEGPGTELKALLSKVGITSTPTCSCNARAAEMNRQGVQWCKDNEELILNWLKEEAEKRNLPFVKLGAKMLLRLAIRNAEKKASQPPKDE